MEYTERIDGFQIRDVSYFGKPPENAPIQFDIVKWVEEKPQMMTVFREVNGKWTASEELVSEHCYSVGFLEWDSHEPQFVFRSVGLRWLKENPSKAVIEMILKFCEEKKKEIEDSD